MSVIFIEEMFIVMIGSLWLYNDKKNCIENMVLLDNVIFWIYFLKYV